jgi:hypothetical protein
MTNISREELNEILESISKEKTEPTSTVYIEFLRLFLDNFGIDEFMNMIGNSTAINQKIVQRLINRYKNN